MSVLAHEEVTLATVAARLGYAHGTVLGWRYDKRRPFAVPFPPPLRRQTPSGVLVFDWPLVASWYERTLRQHVTGRPAGRRQSAVPVGVSSPYTCTGDAASELSTGSPTNKKGSDRVELHN